ncbi:MAG: sugar phosphate isomerase/epimerase, partial [Pseudomonadota bacterium]
NTDYQSTVTLELDPSEFPKGEHIILESLKEILAFLRTETNSHTGHLQTHAHEVVQIASAV